MFVSSTTEWTTQPSEFCEPVAANERLKDEMCIRNCARIKSLLIRPPTTPYSLPQERPHRPPQQARKSHSSTASRAPFHRRSSSARRRYYPNLGIQHCPCIDPPGQHEMICSSVLMAQIFGGQLPPAKLATVFFETGTFGVRWQTLHQPIFTPGAGTRSLPRTPLSRTRISNSFPRPLPRFQPSKRRT